MTRPWMALVAALLTLSQSGCAAIFNPKHNVVRVVSEPPGAEVWIQGRNLATTPCQVDVGGDDDISLELRKPGYRPTIYMLSRTFGGGWVALDVLVPVVGLALGASIAVASEPRPGPGEDVGASTYAIIGSVFAGLLLGAVPALLIDGITGARTSPTPNDISATLQPDSLATSHP